MKHKFYITNSIPYVNARPHVGHALEFVQTDTIRRFHRDIIGEETCLLCGSDDNALKNVQAAEKAGKNINDFVAENANVFEELAVKLNVQFDVFQHGSDKDHHFKASQKLWELCQKDIYKKEYEGLYCVGCEAFYTPDELNEKGECFEHPGSPLQKVSETNYFFKLSKYQDQIIDLINTDKLKITPTTRKNEVLSFLKEPLQDISISRSNERAKNWGVSVPGDDTQRMYVWFDALNIYQSGVGFGWNEENYKKWWPADVHVIGKGIVRFHAVYWPAFLLSAGLELPKALFVHGYIHSGGQKMSKTVGNVIDPFEYIEKYGTEAVRYYLLREIPAYGDGDFTDERFRDLYNADLANGIGNLVARLTTLAEGKSFDTNQPELKPDYKKDLEEYRFNEVLSFIWDQIRFLDKRINDAKPWEIKDDGTLNDVLAPCIESLRQIACELQPFLPETARKILGATNGEVHKLSGLFPRLK